MTQKYSIKYKFIRAILILVLLLCISLALRGWDIIPDYILGVLSWSSIVCMIFSPIIYGLVVLLKKESEKEVQKEIEVENKSS